MPTLPTVQVTVTAPGEPPTVTVNGARVDGVRSAQITIGTDNIPQVVIALAAWAVELDMPAGVAVLQAGPSVAEFVDQLNPARLEAAALRQQELGDSTMGESFAAAVAALAAEFEQIRRG